MEDDATFHIMRNTTDHPFAEGNGENLFCQLVREFFNACNDPSRTATYWIIKATISRGRDTKVVFAAGKNSPQSRHVEKVFINWWKSSHFETWKCKSLRVYTNYTSCVRCVPVLQEWLTANPSLEVSIHYAFVYVDRRMIQDEYDVDRARNTHVKLLRGLRNSTNLAQMNKITTDLLFRLVEEVQLPRNYYYGQYVNCYNRDLDNEYLEVRINYIRI